MAGSGSVRSVSDQLEETLIAATLGVMALVTFANVIARYVFNSNILWALEVTSVLFAWLVLLGISYCVKITAHLGVDAVLNIVPPSLRRVLVLFSAAICIAYAALLLKGGWDYWANFANLPATTGRWLPTGLEDRFLAKGWYETNDIPLPAILSFMQDWFNDGEPYEKLPRLVPYVMVPVGFALLLWRFIQATLHIWKGDRSMMIVSHEAEDAIDAVRPKQEDQG
ncbi:TRAP transporter small permease [Gammaproteobacteria bacterium]|nr:TRAP transporter small permease [Gammaproteobacteria bacterium]